MAPELPTILLIGGGWHVPQSYHKLTTQLQSNGYKVHVPVLPSMNQSRPPTADLNTDTDHVRSFAADLVDKGLEVVVLMHSYGGQIGTNALHGLGLEVRAKEGRKGGVSHLIYLAASAFSEGKAMIDGVKHFGHEELMPLAFDFADDKSCVSRDPKTLLVGETDLPEAEVDKYLASLVRWNGQCMYQPMSASRAAWRDVPVTYIHTTRDMTVPFEYQKWFVEGMRKEEVVVQTAAIETGHCPNLTAAKEVANIIDAVVKGTVQSHSSKESKRTSNDDIRGAIMNANT
ncbi:Alpha/beta hydrolase fold-1 [Phaeosphaeria sp. MPI-PUGE-AT-0046c]|nr:Alpha/beta hydrolase fold-1 [Phaeosphaeria sp. MPI-PUGE-AT-0046c]